MLPVVGKGLVVGVGLLLDDLVNHLILGLIINMLDILSQSPSLSLF